MTVQWALPDDLSAAAAARAHVRETLAARSTPPGAVDDAILVASELAANAVRHGAPPITLRLDVEEGLVRITVSDHGAGPEPRVLRTPDDAHHGRGLSMVSALAQDVGWSRTDDRLDVWAELALA